MEEDTRGVVRLGMPHDQRPDVRDLQRFLTSYCEYWRDIGLQLGLQSSVLDQVAADCHAQRERFRVTLDRWLQVNVRVTWGDLELAITNANRAGLGHEPLTTIPAAQPEVVAIPQHREDDNTRQPVAVNIDHTCGDDSATTINFAAFKNVTDAFAVLINIFTEKLVGANFVPIHTMCLMRADKRLRNKIREATNIHSIFTLLACNPLYLNWMNIDFLETMAFASGNVKLQNTLESYADVVLSKTLGEVWNDVPRFQKTKKKYYSKIRARFHELDPDDIKVKDLKKYQPKFAEEIALSIMEITRGSLTITWCIAAEDTYEAYLLALNIPQELREDDFLQIGMWVAYRPQIVIQKLEMVHTMMTTSTLLIGYYHGLLLRSIDADLLTDKMCSIGLLTAHEQIVISSGHSVHQRNQLLLEHVQHMDAQALRIFCEAVQDIWPQTGLQLITALKYKDVSTSDESHAVTSEVKQDDVDIDTTSSVSQLFFLHLIDQLHKLLQVYKLELVQQCESLNASDGHKISLFSAEQLTELSECNNLFMKLSPLFSWSNHSLLKILAGCSGEAVKLLDEFDSKLDPHQPVTSYPIPCLSSNMIPTDTSTYTILAVRCDQELYQCTLQYVYDVQSVMIEKCDITQHCLQLLAVRSDPTILYWTIPKCVVDLIKTTVPLHSEYLCSRGILEVLVYPDLLLTTGDDVCYGLLAFKCSDRLFNEELEATYGATANQMKEYNAEVILKHVRSQCDSLRSELKNKTDYANHLLQTLNLKKQGSYQTQEQLTKITEATNNQNDGDNLKDELDKESLKSEICTKEELTKELEEKVTELRQNHEELRKYSEELRIKNEEMKITINVLREDDKKSDLMLQQLQKQNDELTKIVNKYQKSKMAEIRFQSAKVNKSSSEFWNSLELKWHQCADLPRKAWTLSAAELDEKVYATVLYGKGGYLIPLMYDHKEDKWSSLPVLPYIHFSLVTVPDYKQLLAIGGMTINHGVAMVSNQVFLFDKDKNKWINPYPNMPTARYRCSSISHGSTVIVVGGVTCKTPWTMTRAVEILHISKHDHSHWSIVEQLPYIVREAIPLIVNEKLYLAQGCGEFGDDAFTCNIITASLSELLQSDNKNTSVSQVWNKLPDMPYSSYSINHYDGHLITFTGDHKVEQLDKDRPAWQSVPLIHIYNPCTNTWDCVGEVPHSYLLGRSIHLNKNKILFMGGLTGKRDLSANKRTIDMVTTCLLLTLSRHM